MGSRRLLAGRVRSQAACRSSGGLSSFAGSTGRIRAATFGDCISPNPETQNSIIDGCRVISFSMEGSILDHHQSPIEIPSQFWDVRYNGAHFPGAAGATGVEGGANCQQYAYSILRHFGFELPDFRSSELWDDTSYTAVSNEMKPFDLVLVNDEPKSFGAHVGLSLGHGLVLHLSKRIGAPAIETLKQMQSRDEYRCLIGFKTVLVQPLT
ncbi:NlpC/P60 family protein [Rhizobium sp. 2YAF20]|uniref:NlpC/P60 family protein n=1 Tax=Rhizobium sp. 2YAF20 TaxID=3233027 RepID=UPI003F98700D